MDSFVLSIGTVLILLFTEIQGDPEVVSTIESLSGRLCPGILTLTCSALQFGTSGTIEWFANYSLIASHTYRPDIVFPLTIQTESQVHGVNVQIQAVTISNEKFNFVNFTLSANLEDMKQFQGQDITCGVQLLRSNSITIGTYTILDPRSALTVFISAIYEHTGKLKSVVVKWKNQNPKCNQANMLISYIRHTSHKRLSTSECNNMIFKYNVKLASNDGSVSYTSLNTTSCLKSFCSTNFTSLNLSRYYVIRVHAINFYNNETEEYISNYISGSSLTALNYSIKTEKCMLLLSCSTMMTFEPCRVRHNGDPEQNILDRWDYVPINSKYILDPKFNPSQKYFIEISTIVNSTTIIVRNNITEDVLTGSFTAILVLNNSDLTLIIFGIIYFTVEIVLLLFYWVHVITRRQKRGKLMQIFSITLVLFLSILLLASLGMWLTVGILYGTKTENYSDFCSEFDQHSIGPSLVTVAHILTDISLLAVACVVTPYMSTCLQKRILSYFKSNKLEVANKARHNATANENSSTKEKFSKSVAEDIVMKENQVYGLKSRQSNLLSTDNIEMKQNQVYGLKTSISNTSQPSSGYEYV